MARLISNDLLTPKGRLNAAALWPKKKLATVNSDLGQFLTEGYEKAAEIPDQAATGELTTEQATEAAQNDIARYWAYYRAYQDAYEIRLSMPSSVSINDQASASTLLTQIEHIGEIATAMLEKFEQLLEGANVTVDAVVPRLGSTSVVNQYRF